MPPKNKKADHLARMRAGAKKREKGDMLSGIRAAAETHGSSDGRIDARQGMATTVFTVESLGLKSTKTASNARKRGIGSGSQHRKGVTTVLAAEASYDVERRIRDARRPLMSEPRGYNELTPSDSRLTDRKSLKLMPARPKWDYELKRGKLHARERKAFVKWLREAKEAMIETGGYAPAFEQNIEVWRQLWRVLERADVAVIVVDARNPMLHLPPALYAHITRRLKKPLVVVLNKIDAVPMQAVEEWAAHFLAALPGIDSVVGFSSRDEAPASERHWQRKTHDPEEERELASQRMHRASKIPVGRDALLEVCTKLAEDGKRFEHEEDEDDGDDEADAEDADAGEEDTNEDPEDEDVERVRQAELRAEQEEADRMKAEGRVMIGLVGHPNVGKSSMVNSLLGRKAVSVKATPGHTKTLQTLILDGKTCLCDSPGLVFPRIDISPAEQIIGNLIPLPVVREPFSAIRWLSEAKLVGAERWNAMQRKFNGSNDGKLAASLAAPITSVLKIRPTKQYDPEVLELLNNEDLSGEDLPWSPLSLCYAYGKMRGFTQARGVDLQRAGQAILGMVYDGKMPYAIPPPIGTPVVRSKLEPVDLEDDDDFEEDESDDDEVKVSRSGFAALAIDSDEETAREQYAYSSDEDESGMFLSMNSILTAEDLSKGESKRGTRKK